MELSRKVKHRNKLDIKGAVTKRAYPGPNNSLIFTVRTEEGVNGNRYVKLHTVRVYDKKLQGIVKNAQVGDIVEVDGPVSVTNELIAKYFSNITYEFTGSSKGRGEGGIK